jgi:hypothetical protein
MQARDAQMMAMKRGQVSRQDRLSRVLEALDAGEDRYVFLLHRRVPKEPRGVHEVPPRNACESRTSAIAS